MHRLEWRNGGANRRAGDQQGGRHAEGEGHLRSDPKELPGGHKHEGEFERSPILCDEMRNQNLRRSLVFLLESEPKDRGLREQLPERQAMGHQPEQEQTERESTKGHQRVGCFEDRTLANSAE